MLLNNMDYIYVVLYSVYKRFYVSIKSTSWQREKQQKAAKEQPQISPRQMK